MRRREFITLIGGAAAWPVAARAQRPDEMRHIGVLFVTGEKVPVAAARKKTLQEGLQSLGWIEGKNVQIDYRFGGRWTDEWHCKSVRHMN
jgi:putative tryptophan/tyrosine transport system substrate-binding protein